ncbi:hypothetical protein ACQ5R9_19775 [Stenotrophomonas geniculata]|jgi:hypothetical protein|uniref:hypothetical protein n=1 Tax=Pseudomonadota TaxID=1224 RepID=UPI0012E2C72A|nr:hypothetical protein [Achromobacter sp. 2789STDY5608633]
MPNVASSLLALALIAVVVIYSVYQGLLEWPTLLALCVGWLAVSYALAFMGRFRVVRVREQVRAVTARLVDGMVKTFYSADSRAFVVSAAAIIKARCSGHSIPNVILRTYRSEGVEHLEARWPASDSSAKTDTVLTFRVDEAFDDRWPDPAVDHAHLPVGDMVDAFVLANLIDDAARGQAPWDAAVADHDEAHKSIA